MEISEKQQKFMEMAGGLSLPPAKVIAFISLMIEQKNITDVQILRDKGMKVDEIFFNVRPILNEKTNMRDILISRVAFDLSGDKPVMEYMLPDFIVVSEKVERIAQHWKNEEYGEIMYELSGEKMDAETLASQLAGFNG